ESRGSPADALRPVSRAAVNLRGLPTESVRRGQALLAPAAWLVTPVVDVRRTGGAALDEVPARLTVHVGTAAVPARLRCFDAEHARITLDWPLPLIVGDRLLLRDP